MTLRDQVFVGGCHCGAVRYRTGAPIDAPTLCHCASCRRTSGAHILGLYTVARSEIQFEQGSPKEYLSSTMVFRGFCATCGTTLTYRHLAWPDEISLTLGSLDHPELLPPKYQDVAAPSS